MKNVEDVYPLSPLQESLLIQALSAHGSGAGFEQSAYTIHGGLDVAAFEETWRRILARHTVLRTGFFAQGLDQPVQVVRQQVRLPLVREDWCEISAAEQRRRLDQYLASDQEKGFDSTRTPLMRLALFTLSAGAHFFVWSFHHLLLDGWSRILVLEEVLAIYEALLRGESPELPTGPPFRDYIAWVQRQDDVQAATFWRASFAGFTGPTPLVIDRIAMGPAGAATESHTREVTEDDAARLRSFARQNQLTLGSVVQGAWALLLARYSGRDEVVFGGTVSGRPGDLPGIEGTVGMFVNNLPVRVQVPAASRVLPWLQELQARLVELRQYEHCSPRQIQDWLGVPWGVRLYESLVIFQNYPDGKLQQGDSGSLAVEPYQSRLETNLPLTLVGSSGPGMRLRLLAKGERFEATTVARMAGHLASLLVSFATNPAGTLCEARLLSDEERHQLLAEDPGLPWRQPAPLPVAHQLFTAAARRFPGSVAVCSGGSRITYREMGRHSDRLAHDLRRLGMRRGEPVAIAMEPCPEAAIALLAVLKAGGVAWLLDPGEADDRLDGSRDDAGPPVVLARSGATPGLASGARVLQVDAERNLPLEEEEPLATAGPEDPACLLRIPAGRAGGPLDVRISHRLLAELCHVAADRLGLGPGEVFLAAGSRSWLVGSALDILVPLGAGANLVFPDPAERADPRLLAQVVATSGATFVQATPGTWRALLDLGWPAERRLAALSCGEALARGLADLLLAATGTLWTIYGPQGSGLWAALNRVQPGAAPISLGAPLSGLRLEILDRHLQPVPVGIPGEVCLSSRPDLPLFRTRDLARFLPDGTLESLGRAGDWSEIRGDRIQLGEVEALLRRLPAVREAALTTLTDASGETTLVACIALDRERTVAAAELRQFLRRALPPYQVPAAFVSLETLPRTAGGRIDRAALPDLAASGSAVLAGFAPPRDPVELQLVQIWEDVLGLSAIGIHDDFFSVGGHSLPAVQVMARIKERFGLDLPLAALFESPTIEKLAVQLRQSANGHPPSALVPIQPRGSQRPFFCIHGLGGEVLIYYDLARCLGTDQPVYGIQAPLLTELGDRCSPLEELAAEYLQAMREVQPAGPYSFGGYSYGSIVAFEMAQQLKRSGEPLGLLAMLDGPSPLVARKGERRSDVVMMAGLARSTARQSGAELSLPHEELQALPPNEALAHILAELHKASLVPTGVDLAWVQRALHGVRLREEALQRYEPEPYDGTITLFRSTETEIESARAWREIGVDVEDRTRGWDELSTRPVEVRYVPGYHATILTLPNVRILAASLKECLNRINETSD
jgi:non-ribosomal peptide synthetase component F/thioesterase domain-containing protein/acyl carrier protein